MYNRYIPQGEPFQPMEPPPQSGPRASGPSLFQSLFGQDGEKNAGLSGILKALKLDRFDKGDILLILLLLYLAWNGKEGDGENKELLIILGLVLLLGL